MSDDTYFGVDDPYELRLLMYAERRPLMGAAERYFKTIKWLEERN